MMILSKWKMIGSGSIKCNVRAPDAFKVRVWRYILVTIDVHVWEAGSLVKRTTGSCVIDKIISGLK